MSAISGSSANNYANTLSGLQDASLRVKAVTHNLANATTDGFSPDRVDSQAEKTGGVRGQVAPSSSPRREEKTGFSETDTATESTHLTLARRAFSANLKASQAQRQADQAIIDTVG
ncbi:flagellar basal body protein [Vampirovibrio sp.]|uniref:flagellar basal body protein n=1 Tax=Vampirovibrio sp. TaxID=2717857 RepID=UPI0035948588